MKPRACRKCRRPLRSALWRARGIGPVCARKAGLVPLRACPTVLVRSVRAIPGDGQLPLFELPEKGAA